MNDCVMSTAMIMYYNVRQKVGRETEVIMNRKKEQEITKRVEIMMLTSDGGTRQRFPLKCIKTLFRLFRVLLEL